MNFDKIILHPGCKINLHLRILCRREDGYHSLSTLFYKLNDPSDVLTLQPAHSGQGLAFSCSNPELTGPGNLVVKAYGLFTLAASLALDIRVHLDKRIPVGGGLGGGSADAATMLLALNRLAGDAALPPGELAGLALKLGADVPFFLHGEKACWAEGVGEKLNPMPLDLTGFSLVLCCPRLPVSTAWAYGAWDALHRDRRRSPRQGGLTCLPPEGKDRFFVDAVSLFNSFEEVVEPMAPAVREIKQRALMAGAAGTLMSGSGSSVFALFRDDAQAAAFARFIQGDPLLGPDRVFHRLL